MLVRMRLTFVHYYPFSPYDRASAKRTPWSDLSPTAPPCSRGVAGPVTCVMHSPLSYGLITIRGAGKTIITTQKAGTHPTG